MFAKLTKTSQLATIAFVRFRTVADAAAAREQMQGFVVQSEPLVTLDIVPAHRSLSAP